MITMHLLTGAEVGPSLINGDLSWASDVWGRWPTPRLTSLLPNLTFHCGISGQVSSFINSLAFARTVRIRIKLVAGDRDVETWSCLVEFDPLLDYSGYRWNYIEDNNDWSYIPSPYPLVECTGTVLPLCNCNPHLVTDRLRLLRLFFIFSLRTVRDSTVSSHGKLWIKCYFRMKSKFIKINLLIYIV